MSEQKNMPVISRYDRLLSASVFSREVDLKGDGKLQTVYSVCIQRSYQNKKKGDEWIREKINLTPDECLRMAAMLTRTYQETLDYAREHKKDSQNGGNYPAQSFDAPEAPAADLDDDIPF